jgi:HK97 family phage major capsid protein
MITPYRQTFTTPVTQDLLLNAGFDMDAEMARDAAEAFALGEGQGFVSGTGFKQPSGIFTNAALQAGARLTGVSGQLTPNSVILLTGDLKVGYSPVYVMNRRTLALIRTFRGDAASPGDQAGQYLWQPGLNGPAAATICGFPYVLANSVPDVAAGAFVMVFGDFRAGYSIVDRTGVSVVRDEVSQKRRAIVEFTWLRWVTGQVVLPEAIKLLQVTP